MSTTTRGSIAIESTLMLSIATTLLISISLIILGCVVKENIEYSVHESIESITISPLVVTDGGNYIGRIINEKMVQAYLENMITSRLPSSFHSFIHLSMKHSYYNALTGEGRLTINASMQSIPLQLINKNYYYKTIYQGDGQVNMAGESEEVVYITRTGKKYHHKDCSHLRKSKFPLHMKEAIERGYEACKNCMKGTKKKP